MVTSMTVREMRSRLVYEELLGQSERIVSREEIARMPRFVRWRVDVLDRAIRDLLDAGLLAETLDGSLAIQPRRVG